MLEKKQKSGSALLLGLMIMSVILSSTLYINVLSIRSMGQSQSIDNSIVAFYAAETGNEQAIYHIRKNENLVVGELDLPGGKITGPDSLVLRTVEDSVQNILIGLEENETYQVDIFDQDDLSIASSIDHLSLSWSDNCDPGSESKIELTANEWTAGENINWGNMQKQMHINKCLLSESLLEIESPIEIDASGLICSDIQLDKYNSYQFRLKALGCDIYNLSISAFDSYGEPIDFKNIYTIESVGEYPVDSARSNRQALRVNLRRFSPLSGLFDYVLFSEKALVKDVGAYTSGWFGGDLLISTDSLPDATQGSPYSYAVRAVNGTLPYEWSLTTTPLLPELGIDSGTGVLSGTIPSAGFYLLRIEVTDRDYASDSKTLFLQVNE